MTLAEAVVEMTPAKLEAWLESLPEKSQSFLCDDCYECLLARYLTDQVGVGPVDVGKRLAHFRGGSTKKLTLGEEECVLPGWAILTINLFDGGGVVSERGVKSCLRILRSKAVQEAFQAERA